MKQTLGLAALVALGPALVRADLPLHCLPEDIIGRWSFTTDGAPFAASAGLPRCGHAAPNSVSSMLSLVGGDARAKHVPSAERLEVTLTNRAAGYGDDRRLVAVGPGGEEGRWTMVFDEGFEVQFGGRSFFAQFEFELMHGAVAKDGDMLDKIGSFYGQAAGHNLRGFDDKVYACYCNRTTVGWHSRPTTLANVSAMFSGERSHRGCFHAERLDAGAPPALLALSGCSEDKPKKKVLSKQKSGDAKLVKSGKERARGRPLSDWAVALKIEKEPEALPENWDWRKQPALEQPGDDLASSFDQGACGSCWAFSGVVSLAMRFRIALQKRLGHTTNLELSWRGMTRCSPYNEGCSGGFTLLVGRQAQEIGVFQETTTAGNLSADACDVDLWAGHVTQPCPATCALPNPKLQPVYFASSYGYVGGFGQGASEEAIMRELYAHGPLCIELSVRAIPMLMYGNSGAVITPFDNTRPITDDVPTAATEARLHASMSAEVNQTLVKLGAQPVAFHDWLWIDHALLSVGWGESGDEHDALFLATDRQASFLQSSRAASRTAIPHVKYWHIRNSWGELWGSGGYAKLVRGQNAGGIEISAVFIRPDLSRLPAHIPAI